jgi:hypothetical protein
MYFVFSVLVLLLLNSYNPLHSNRNLPLARILAATVNDPISLAFEDSPVLSLSPRGYSPEPESLDQRTQAHGRP